MIRASTQPGSPAPGSVDDDHWLMAQRLFDGTELRDGVALRLREGRVAELAAATQAECSDLPVRRIEGTVCAGFFDLQVNGGAGKMFNTEPSVATLAHVGAALRAAGTTAWLPTFITDAPQRMAQAAGAIVQSCWQHGVVGVHFEGPHISHERRGAHQAQWIRPIDESTFALLRGLRRHGIPVLLTLAPECQPRGSIARLCTMGVTVSIGHSAANAEQVNAALTEGARCFTHLFNGMTPMSAREPGVVGVALDSEAWCGVIADGHHVADAVVRLALRSRPRPDRTVLVSDAMATTHGPGHFDLYGETIQLVAGKLINRAGSLAGAHIDLAGCVHRVIGQLGLPPTQVLPMAGRYPAELMGLSSEIGHVRVGARADLIVLDGDWKFERLLCCGGAP